MPGLRLEHLENIHDRITEGLNQGFGKITDRLDALDPAGLFSRDQTFIRFNSFEHRVTYFHFFIIEDVAVKSNRLQSL